MNLILFDASERQTLLPLTLTRPIADLRIGILKISEKWNRYLETECSFLTESYLQEKFPMKVDSDNLLINGALLPEEDLVEQIKKLEFNQFLTFEDTILAARIKEDDLASFFSGEMDNYTNIEYDLEVNLLKHPWEIFKMNGEEMEADFDLITKGRTSQKLSSNVQVLGEEFVFVEEGARAEFVTINAETGPVYIGKDAEIMEGAVIRGPFALCEHSTVKMSAKIYGATTIGPHSKVGGELNNVVVQGYSNKAHDGFLGNSVIGEWCNLGADTNNSNLKNNYAEVRLWSYSEQSFVNTGLQFCGLIMGDHSKCGINTMFNTGTVVGVSSNIFGSGFPRNYIPSFSWGGAHGMKSYNLDKAIEVAELVYQRRNLTFDETEKNIFRYIYELDKK